MLKAVSGRLVGIVYLVREYFGLWLADGSLPETSVSILFYFVWKQAL